MNEQNNNAGIHRMLENYGKIDYIKEHESG